MEDKCILYKLVPISYRFEKKKKKIKNFKHHTIKFMMAL